MSTLKRKKTRDMKAYFEFAIDNITKYGDTDIFPFPIENHIFFDKKDEVVKILLNIHKDYDNYMTKNPPQHLSTLVSSGYTGFRWATQLDPIWNAYFLGIVLSISGEIENDRIPKEKNYVFSYRIKLDNKEKSIFDSDYGWHKFQKESIENAKNYKYVLVCDISNFYSNVYHHRLDNSLRKLEIPETEITKNIMDFLQNFNNIKSYGLPIGGQASRILAELLLISTDKLLKGNAIKFCRFVDDYHIFANTEEELYSHLLLLSQALIENEGLSLQKSKTRIMSSDEFIKSSDLLLENDSEIKGAKNYLFSISYKYDPYSQTAEEDYERLKNEIGKLNILGILSDELNKSRVHTSVMKKLLGAIKFIDKDLQSAAVSSLIDNMDILAPVFPNVMTLINNLYENLDDNTQKKTISCLQEMIRNSSYLMKIDLNLAYSLRVLSNEYNDDNEEILISLYNKSRNLLIRRDIILIMSAWRANYWISNLKNNFSSLSIWEKRSFIISSYILNDEGRHWRDHYKKDFSEFDILYRDWAADKIQQKGGNWRLPI